MISWLGETEDTSLQENSHQDRNLPLYPLVIAATPSLYSHTLHPLQGEAQTQAVPRNHPVKQRENKGDGQNNLIRQHLSEKWTCIYFL